MTIQRQYNLPNCTLLLEGFSNAAIDPSQVARPSLDRLMRFECRFANPDRSLTGGSDLLQSLVRATNQCAQEWMSGVRHVQAHRSHHGKDVVIAQPSEEDGFHLEIPSRLLSAPPGKASASEKTDKPETDAPPPDAPPIGLNLTTVQLFDLVEALDQLLADTQTLPNLSTNVRPLTHREAISGQPIAKRAAPLVLGTTSLAIAAAALFLLPVPEVRKPTKTEPASPDAAVPTDVQPTPNDATQPPPEGSPSP